MRALLYIIRFAMPNRETLYRTARHNLGRRALSLGDGVAYSIESWMRPSRANKRD
jgi:hypothetical protein